MKREIEITNLKNVRSLRFELPEPGVWLLTGENGSGKTTLLVCLRRLKFPNAFQAYFKTSAMSRILDNFQNSTIKYTLGSDQVSYRYTSEKWAPTPKKNINILKDFGYSHVEYIGATADRITPKPDEFEVKRLHNVEADLVGALNEIFSTNRFDNLKRVNVTPGVNEAFVLRSGQSYYSEKNFSLGELCVLKLLKRVLQARPLGLIIVDELEMALHPSAQIRLLIYLRRFARERSVTIIFSTHSVSLIKAADRREIIFMRSENGIVTAERKPYISNVLGFMALAEEKTADTFIYVEDDMAEYCVRTLLELEMQIRFNSNQLRPRIEVVPIGGVNNVVKFLEQHAKFSGRTINAFALLDGDAKREESSQIKKLPWVPESQIHHHVTQDFDSARNAMRRKFSNNVLQLPSGLLSLTGSPSSKQYKDWVSRLVSFLVDNYQVNQESARRCLCEIIAEDFDKNDNAAARSLIGPCI